MTIKDNSVIGPFPGQGNVHVKAGTLELMSGEIIGTGDSAYQTDDSCGVYVTNKASVKMSGGVIRIMCAILALECRCGMSQRLRSLAAKLKIMLVVLAVVFM